MCVFVWLGHTLVQPSFLYQEMFPGHFISSYLYWKSCLFQNGARSSKSDFTVTMTPTWAALVLVLPVTIGFVSSINFKRPKNNFYWGKNQKSNVSFNATRTVRLDFINLLLHQSQGFFLDLNADKMFEFILWLRVIRSRLRPTSGLLVTTLPGGMLQILSSWRTQESSWRAVSS